ncbi:MAG: hypothetical protein WCJ64_01885 [Rhodospirillaceae bacterium]
MANPVDTTGARACASLLDTPDPVVLLLELRQRQLEAWRALPESADALRNPVADISWGAIGALLAQLRPTTAAGAVLALRHLFQCLRHDQLSADSDYPLPLAERALTTLEQSLAT